MNIDYFDEKDAFLSGSRVQANYTYMDHTFESYNTVVVDENGENPEEVNFDGNTLPGIHPHTFVGGLDIVTKPGFYFNGTYSFFDDIFLNNENSSEDDSYQLLNFKIGFAKRISDNIGFNVV
ncbi:MAG: TonB-dependent receptor [Bacteroidota bacterium]